MTENNKIVPVEVFSGTQGEVYFLLSLLENAEIPVYLKDEYAGQLFLMFPPGGAAPITIVVSSEDEEKARQVVNEYLKNENR